MTPTHFELTGRTPAFHVAPYGMGEDEDGEAYVAQHRPNRVGLWKDWDGEAYITQNRPNRVWAMSMEGLGW